LCLPCRNVAARSRLCVSFGALHRVAARETGQQKNFVARKKKSLAVREEMPDSIERAAQRMCSHCERPASRPHKTGLRCAKTRCEAGGIGVPGEPVQPCIGYTFAKRGERLRSGPDRSICGDDAPFPVPRDVSRAVHRPRHELPSHRCRPRRIFSHSTQAQLLLRHRVATCGSRA
jgi:hypothetical protein